jgi:hypothetical protein
MEYWSDGVLGNHRSAAYLAELTTRDHRNLNIFLSDPYVLLGLDQYSSTPILQHSGASFKAEPIIFNHTLRAEHPENRFSPQP